MRRSFWIPVILFAASSALTVRADLLWDNYQGPDGYDHVTATSSERATIVSDSWLVDDAVVAVPWTVTGIQWIGARVPGINYSGADFIILDGNLNLVTQGTALPYTAEVIGTDFINAPETYQGFVSVPNVALAPGHYYFGTRLVDNGLGRNFVATTGNGNIQGLTMGMFRSPDFGFDEWVFVNEIPQAASDFAYRIFGTPEPASVALLLIGAWLLPARRSTRN